MKRTIVLILIGAVIGGGIVWLTTRGGARAPENGKSAPENPAAEEARTTTITHGTNGEVVIGMNAGMQAKAGIATTNPAPAQWSRELKGYGRVLDPTPLAALLSELDSAQAAYAASSNELARVKSLESGGNTSARAVQSAEAAARHDQLAVQSARDRLALSWGQALAGQDDLAAFIQSLTAFESVLVRIDVPADAVPESPPGSARIVSMPGRSIEAEFRGVAPGTDPQIPGRGYIFLIQTNTVHLLANEAVTGYLRIPGEPLSGVIVPRDAVVRTEGKGWVYVLNSNGESFARREIALDHPVAGGWFVTNGVTAASGIVVTGAQTLLSEEMKASISPD